MTLRPVSKATDLVGAYGKAWLVDLDVLRKQSPEPAPDATLAMWIVEAPWAHLAWHSYAILLMHLRPLAGLQTLMYVDGGTHEIHVYAMDPDAERERIILGGDIHYFRHMLTPVNFAAQFIEKDDVSAVERVKDTVQHVCNGKLSPDTDFIRSWAAIYGDNMMRDREHGQFRQPIKRKD